MSKTSEVSGEPKIRTTSEVFLRLFKKQGGLSFDWIYACCNVLPRLQV